MYQVTREGENLYQFRNLQVTIVNVHHDNIQRLTRREEMERIINEVHVQVDVDQNREPKTKSENREPKSRIENQKKQN